MLIDYTYFFGDCSIGQLSEQAIKDKISWLIQQYESEYLQGLLGYATYKSLIAGLTTIPVPQIWLDLLNGKEYTDVYAKTVKWKGLLQIPGSVSTVTNSGAPYEIQVGRGREFDPVDGSASVTIPDAFVGKDFMFQQRMFGPLAPGDEYSISMDGETLTLLNGVKFSSQDRFFYFGNSQISIDSGDSTFKISPIAYYVYYMYQRNHVSTTGGTGEGALSTQNSTPVSPKQKMVTAWNKMVYLNRELCDFLYSNKDVYTDWYPSIFQGYGLFNAKADNSLSKFLTTINTMF